MTTRNWLLARMNHTCTILRNNGTAQSSSGMPLDNYSNEVGSAVPCHIYNRQEKGISESSGDVVVTITAAIFKSDIDVKMHDRIRSVKFNGTATNNGVFSVERVEKNRDIGGTTSYIEVMLDRPGVS